MAAWGELTSWHGGGLGRVDELIQEVRRQPPWQRHPHDKKGVHLYNRFRKSLEELKSHGKVSNVVVESIRLWKVNQEVSDKSKKRRRTNVVTDETASPIFDLLGIGMGLGPIDVTGAV